MSTCFKKFYIHSKNFFTSKRILRDGHSFSNYYFFLKVSILLLPSWTKICYQCNCWFTKFIHTLPNSCPSDCVKCFSKFTRIKQSNKLTFQIFCIIQQYQFFFSVKERLMRWNIAATVLLFSKQMWVKE